MPRPFKISVAGGISAVVDTAYSDGKHVAYMENLDVRGGKATPYQMPLLNPNIVVPSGSIQVFAYRSRLLFSQARRDYVADYYDNRERIYWTEYGGNPKKMIDGTVVSLGTVSPNVPPGVSIGTAIAPQNIIVTVSPGGALAKGTQVSFRLAYQTAFGVLPPSGVIQPTISTDGSAITLNWDNPTLDTPVTQILVFLGMAGGDEKFFALLGAKATSFTYDNDATASGELASDYDQSFEYEYCTTYLRDVNGVQDESGPSSPSPSVQASSSRNITVSPWAEGILDSPNLITWTDQFQLSLATALLGYSMDQGVTNAIGVTGITLETGTNRVLVQFSASHNFYDGQRILFNGLTPNPFANEVVTVAGNFAIGTVYTILAPGTTNFTLIGAANNSPGTVFTATGAGFGTGTATYTQNNSVEIQVLSPTADDLSPAPMLTTCYLLEGPDFVPPGAGLAGVTAYAVPRVGVSGVTYNASAGTIELETAQPHTFNDEKALFTGFSDTGWESQMVPVLGDPNNINQIFVDSKSLPSDTVFAVPSGSLVPGTVYQIISPGTTDFTTVGASNNLPGTIFTASGTASGTGQATSHFVSLPIVAVSLVQGGAASTGTTPATDLVPKTAYMITSVGTSDFTSVGAPGNTVGATFIATGPASGTGTATPCPIIGDVLYFDMTVSGIPIQEAHAVLATPANGFLINASIVGVTGSLGSIYDSGIQFIPFNDYLFKRNIYRAGGTTSFQLCKQLAMDDLSFLDAIPDQGLGAILPTLFTYNGVDVVFQPAQFGLAGLTRHNGIGFSYDPGSNRVLWTAQNNLDAWVPEFYKDFDYRILALASFDQALCVLCEDGIHRADGTDPTNLIWTPTKADPCRAGGSVQILNNRLLYLSDQGITAFSGQESTCLTDLQIPGDFWLANSRYLGSSDPGQFLVPALQNAAYERLRGADLPSVTPRDLMPYAVSRTTQRDGIRSFIKYGKYYIYWGADYPEFAAQTMLCIDFSAPGHPITVIGVKAVDAFVDELERIHMILTCPVAP